MIKINSRIKEYIFEYIKFKYHRVNTVILYLDRRFFLLIY